MSTEITVVWLCLQYLSTVRSILHQSFIDIVFSQLLLQPWLYLSAIYCTLSTLLESRLCERAVRYEALGTAINKVAFIDIRHGGVLVCHCAMCLLCSIIKGFTLVSVTVV